MSNSPTIWPDRFFTSNSKANYFGEETTNLALICNPDFPVAPLVYEETTSENGGAEKLRVELSVTEDPPKAFAQSFPVSSSLSCYYYPPNGFGYDENNSSIGFEEDG